jgi:alpha-L-fucosidase
VNRTYGDPREFECHDFAPLFKAEKWDPDRSAALYKQAGADFAGVCAEHGDGFAMWDTKFDQYSAMDKGPHP